MVEPAQVSLSERWKYLGLLQPRLARRRPPQTNLLNQIYDQMWLIHNFFHPVMRQQNGSARSCDRPQPAFDRLCAATALDPQRQATLAELRSTTNPPQLRNEIHALLDRLSRLPSAGPGRPQDVRRTLFQHTSQHEQVTAPVRLPIEASVTAWQHSHVT